MKFANCPRCNGEWIKRADDKADDCSSCGMIKWPTYLEFKFASDNRLIWFDRNMDEYSYYFHVRNGTFEYVKMPTLLFDISEDHLKLMLIF